MLDLDFHMTTRDITMVVCGGLTKVGKEFHGATHKFSRCNMMLVRRPRGVGVRRCRRSIRMAEGGLATVAVVVLGPGGAIEAAQQKQDFGLTAATDAIAVGLLDSTRILVIS